jgi:hypothetical protein
VYWLAMNCKLGDLNMRLLPPSIKVLPAFLLHTQLDPHTQSTATAVDTDRIRNPIPSLYSITILFLLLSVPCLTPT